MRALFSRSHLLVSLVAGLSALVFVFHFGMTLAYLTPLNPLKLRFLPLINRYMNPFFEQNWHLFAPNPVTDTRVLMVACRVRKPTGELAETDWIDITTPYWDAHFRNRLGPADRVVRVQTNAARLIYTTDEMTMRLKTKLEEQRAKIPEEERADTDKIVDDLKKEEEKTRLIGIHVLNRAAIAHCDNFYGLHRTEAVRVRMAVLNFPRFSERHLPDSDGKLSYSEHDWTPREEVASLSTEVSMQQAKAQVSAAW